LTRVDAQGLLLTLHLSFSSSFLLPPPFPPARRPQFKLAVASAAAAVAVAQTPAQPRWPQVRSNALDAPA